MKRWIAGLLLICLCMGLCACQSEKEREELQQQLELDVMKAAFSEFSGKAQYVRVNVESFEESQESQWAATGYIYFSTSQTVTHVATFSASMTVSDDGTNTSVEFLEEYDIG